MPDPAKVYHGRPCKYGHGTLRWRCNSHCVECDRRRALKANHSPEGWAEKRASKRRHYEHMSGPAYSRMMLRHRRTKALARMAKRNERRTSGAL